MDDDLRQPYWVRYTSLNRLFNMTDLARQQIADEKRLEAELSTEIEELWS